MERINNNSSSRQNKALDKTKNMFGDIKDERLKRRSLNTYVDDNILLTETLIDVSGKNIKNKIKKTKIKKND